jgi:hypothetical protein
MVIISNKLLYNYTKKSIPKKSELHKRKSYDSIKDFIKYVELKTYYSNTPIILYPNHKIRNQLQKLFYSKYNSRNSNSINIIKPSFIIKESILNLLSFSIIKFDWILSYNIGINIDILTQILTINVLKK